MQITTAFQQSVLHLFK